MSELPLGRFTPSSEDLAQCVRCGLCLQHCPTFVETGLETESPRGRLYLIRALAEGRANLTPNAASHLDLCLQCRNCEAVCPSGVPYGRIMEHARAAVLDQRRPPPNWRLRSLFLREVVARPGRLRAFTAALRLYRAIGLRAMAERVPLIRERALQAPSIRGSEFRERGDIASPAGAARNHVALLSGCIMPLAYGRVHRASARVLARNGCRVSVPAGQVCCGALHAHNGDLAFARTLARQNIDAFLASGADAIVVNSAGCGAAMKEYPQLLQDDPAYSSRAAAFSLRVRDISEFLSELPFVRPRGRLERTVTYQDPCHLAHAQHITGAPREIIRAIPGLELRELAHADRCCGAAGVYAMTQSAMSARLLEAKMRDVAAANAFIIATANPGCMAQLEAGLRRYRMPGRVLHVVELLDRAYRNETPTR